MGISKETLFLKLGLGLLWAVFGLALVGVAAGFFSGTRSEPVFGASSTVNFSSTLTITNAAPIIETVVLNGGSDIALVGNATTAVPVSVKVADYNGCSEILNGTTTILVFRSGVTSSTCLTTTDNLNCYQATIFNATSSCAGDSITIYATATVGIYYFADATDASSSYSAQTWIANARVTDVSGSSTSGGTDSAGVDLLTLTAMEKATSSINYGTLNASTTSGGVNEILPLINVGNSSATIKVSGTALSQGSNPLPTSSQHYASSSFYFGGSEQPLSETQTTITGLTFLSRVSFVNDLGSWTETTALPNNVKTAAYANNASYLYVTGGQTTSTVRFASFGGDGALSSWTNTTALPSARLQHAAAVFGDYLYVIGGSNIPSVAYAFVNADGTLDSWSSSGGPTGFEMYNLSAVVYKGYLYLFGGVGGGDAEVNDAYFAPFNANGSLTDWVAATDLPSNLSLSAAVAYNDYVYVIGGESGGSATSTVIFASVGSDGSLGSWSNTTALPAVRTALTAVVEDGYVYVLGGNTGSATSSVLYASINSTGSIGTWTAATSAPFTQSIAASVVNNGYVYYLPNAGTTSTAAYAPIYNARVRGDTFWGLHVPASSLSGEYNGVNTFTAVYTP